MKITSEILAAIAPGTSAAKRNRFLPFLNNACPRFEINNELRVAAFLATCAPESDWFRATEEYGKGKGRYYGRPDKITGKTYYGRGIIQTTHKANYKAFTDFVKESDFYEEKPDFVLNPELLAEPFWAVESACYYWQSNDLNKYADRGQFFEIEGLVNRGSAKKEALHYDNRLNAYRKALKVIPDDFSFDEDSAAEQLPPTVSDTLPAEKPLETPAVDNPPPPKENADSVVESSSILTKTTTAINSVNENTNKIQTTVESVSKTTSKISGSSIFASFGTKLGGWFLMLWGLFKDNWEIILVAMVLIIAALIYLNYSKNRAQERALRI